MKAQEILELLEGQLLCGQLPEEELMSACGSDMMSDVLAFHKEKMVLLTGLTNAHVIRTADMLDCGLIVFVRGKIPGDDVVELAAEHGICVITSPCTLYEACGKLYTKGLPGAARSGR